jgi:PucR family transcriptional regulator, purine catabolism regulatory protein
MTNRTATELTRLLDSGQGAPEYCRSVLSALLAYDAAHNTDLVHTLRSYFRCNGNVIRTAEVLFLHRNSVLYRLQRIEDLLEVDLKDSQDRLVLHLAVELTELLEEQTE